MGARPVPGPTQITGVPESGGSFIKPVCKPILKESPGSTWMVKYCEDELNLSGLPGARTAR